MEDTGSDASSRCHQDLRTMTKIQQWNQMSDMPTIEKTTNEYDEKKYANINHKKIIEVCFLYKIACVN